MWLVVEFIDENAVEAIPKKWYISLSKESYWPVGLKREKIRSLIKQKECPQSDWSIFKVEVLGEYDNFGIAEQKANKAKESDNLNSSQNEDYNERRLGRGHRVSRKSRKYSSSDESREYSSDSDLVFPAFDSQKTDVPQKLNTRHSQESVVHKNSEEKDPSKVIDVPKNLHSDHQKISTKNDAKRKGPLQDTNLPESLKKGDAPRAKKPDASAISQNSVESEPIRRERGVSSSSSSSTFTSSGFMARSNASSEQLDIQKQLKEMKTLFMEFQKQTFRELHIISLKLSDLNEYIYDMKPKKDHHTYEIPQVLSLLPIKMGKLEEMEEWLKESSDNQDLLAQELGRIGGSKLGDIVRRIMYRVFTNKLGNLYSWEGAKQKLPFKSLEISKVVLKAVRLNKAGKHSTETEIINVIKYWLVRCKDRMNKDEITEQILEENSEEKNEDALIQVLDRTITNGGEDDIETNESTAHKS